MILTWRISDGISIPPKPWTDGQLFETESSNGTSLIGVYNESKTCGPLNGLQKAVLAPWLRLGTSAPLRHDRRLCLTRLTLTLMSL